MKKQKFLLLAALGAFMLAGCSSAGVDPVDDDEVVDEDKLPDDAGGDEEVPTDPIGRKKIKIMFHVDSTSEEGIAYAQRVDAFNAAYADKYVATPIFKARTEGAADNKTQLITMKLNGTLPDVITFDAPNCAAYAEAGLLYNITSHYPEADRNDFISTNMYANRLYGLPVQESSGGFFYNKAMFAQAGINVDGYDNVKNPWTFDQFKDACRKLKDNVPGLKYPVDMRYDATKDETATYLLYPFIYASGGAFVSKNGYNSRNYYNKQETKNGFNFLKEIYTSGYTGYDIEATDFFVGRTAMYLSSGWTIADFEKYKSTFPNRDAWGFLPYPQNVDKASCTASWSYGVTRNNIGDKEPAMELLKFMASAESSTAITNSTKMIPCRKSCNPSYADGSAEKILLDQLSETGKERPVTVGYPKFSETFRSVITKMRDKDVSELVEDATVTLQNHLDDIRENQEENE